MSEIAERYNDLLLQQQKDVDKVRSANVKVFDEYLDFLSTKDGGDPAFTQRDVSSYNPVILALGSPSPETFVAAAKQWRELKNWWGWNSPVPVVASTGRGRGYKELLVNTVDYLKKLDQRSPEARSLKSFVNGYQAEVQKTLAEDIVDLMSDYERASDDARKNMLTEAKIIEALLIANGVDKKDIYLEEKSNNGLANITDSFEFITAIQHQAPFYQNGKALKVLVVADSFFNLRAGLTTMGVLRYGKPNDRAEKIRKRIAEWERLKWAIS